MKRRRFSSDFKLQCVLDMVSGRKSPAQICRERNISESSLLGYLTPAEFEEQMKHTAER